MADRFLQLLHPTFPPTSSPLSLALSPLSPFSLRLLQRIDLHRDLLAGRPPSGDSKSSLCTANGEKKEEEVKTTRANPANVGEEGENGGGEGVGAGDDRGIRWIQRRVRRRAAALREMISRGMSPG